MKRIMKRIRWWVFSLKYSLGIAKYGKDFVDGE
jgi:hypothetical protein